jgi:hypothetical protein
MFYFLQHILTGAHAPKYCDTFDRPKSPLKFDLDTIYLKYYKDKTIDYQAKISTKMKTALVSPNHPR